MDWLPPARPQPGIEPSTQTDTLTGNLTGQLFGRRDSVHPMKPLSSGLFYIFIAVLENT